MEYRLTIPFVLPGLNDYIREERGHWSKAANLKSSAQKKIVLLCRKDLHGVRIEKPVFIHYLWIEKNRRRDRDNIAFAKKFIQDALVEAKVISNDPIRAISKLHERKKERLDKYSVVVKLTTTDGKQYNTIVYNRKGIMEICRHSGQPKADAFMDWVWDVIDGIITGEYALGKKSESPIAKAKRLEIQEKNARAKTANLYLRIADNDVLPSNYRGVFLSYASKELSGQEILPLPKAENKTYSATEIGEIVGATSAKIGRLANQHNLKTNLYGQLYHDKSKYSAKEVDTFRYYENAIPKFKELLEVR